MRPGFDTELRDSPIPRSAPTDVSTWFVVGPTEKGPLAPTLEVSPEGYSSALGGSVPFSSLPVAVEQFFAEGGSRVYVKRIVGPAAAVATHSFQDATPADTLAVDAFSPGTWGDSLRVEITRDGATFALVVTDAESGQVLAQSPDFNNKVDAVDWGLTTDVIRVRSLAPDTIPTAVGPTALTGGDNDIDGITNADYIAGLAALPKGLGPGQVSIPGATTSALHSAILAHCAANNRRAVLDLPDDPDVAVVTTAALAARGDTNARFGAAFGPWDVVPGVAANTTRVAPPCGRVAGTIARVDSATGNPNLPAAGDNGLALNVLDLTQAYTDAEYEALNDASANMSRTLFGSDVQVYGFRTLVDPDADPRWIEFSGSRTIMWYTAQANLIMAGFSFDQIDGQGHKFAELQGALTEPALRLFAMGALYGRSPQEALRVDAGPGINTPENVRNRELRAVAALKTSPFAEHVVTEIVRRMVGEEV